jgi:hypothetical protein
MKIILIESKREMLFKSEFKSLFKNLTPIRTGHSQTLFYVDFDEVYDADESVTALLYRPNNHQLVVYMDYFINLRPFALSETEMMEMIKICYEELTDNPVKYSEIWVDNYL